MDSRQEALEVVQKDGLALESVDDKFKSDSEIVLEAVKSNGWALEYAHETLKSDSEIVLEAAKDVYESF